MGEGLLCLTAFVSSNCDFRLIFLAIYCISSFFVCAMTLEAVFFVRCFYNLGLVESRVFPLYLIFTSSNVID